MRSSAWGLAAILGSSLVVAQTTDCSSVECTTSGAHIVVTRESGAPSGTSAMNIIALGVKNQCAGSDIAETPYPAELDPYLSSEQEGVGNLTELVLSYQSCCPDSQIVLMGYSQASPSKRRTVPGSFATLDPKSHRPSTSSQGSSYYSMLIILEEHPGCTSHC